MDPEDTPTEVPGSDEPVAIPAEAPDLTTDSPEAESADEGFGDLLSDPDFTDDGEDVLDEVEASTESETTGQEEPTPEAPAEVPDSSLATPAETVATEQEAPKPVEPAAAAATPETPDPAPVPAPTVQPEPEPQQQQPAQDPAEVRAGWKAGLREVYKLTDEEKTQLADSPAEAIESILMDRLAEVHLQAIEGAQRGMQQMLPQMVSAQLQQKTSAEKNMKAFFDRWNGKLDPQADAGAVLENARLFRSMNPQATTEEAIEQVGLMTLMKLGRLAQAAAAEVQPQAPQAPAAPTPIIRPDVPAAAHAGGAAPQAQGNEFTELADFELEDF